MAFAAPLDTSIHVILPMQETLETQVRSLGWEAPLEEGTAAHSSILAWIISWTEEPGGLQSIGPSTKQPTLSLFGDDIKYKGGCA